MSRPLAQKLGLKPDHRFALDGPPDGFLGVLQPLPEGAKPWPGRGAVDVVVLFATEHARLVERVPHWRDRLDPAGGLWVAWPKKASKLATDLEFAVVQRLGLEAGMVDNKVCAIDETWSGLRFVFRREDRASLPPRV